MVFLEEALQSFEAVVITSSAVTPAVPNDFSVFLDIFSKLSTQYVFSPDVNFPTRSVLSPHECKVHEQTYL